MRKTGYCAIVALLMAIAAPGFASTNVSPTTTLTAETGNNTSTSNGFGGTRNGNPAPSNVSKVDTRTLLYAGSSTKIYAHYMPWFGQSFHVNVGYSGDDPNQANNTVNDMVSRGIQGVIVDWYGQNHSFEDQATQDMLQASQQHAGFEFAIMIDAGGISGDPTGAVISELDYAWQRYMQAGNYMRKGGRPMVFFFGVENLGVNWGLVRNNAPGNPLFIFENSAGFTDGFSDGGFAWIGAFGNPADWGQSYLDNFYQTGQSTGKHVVGSVKKGFNDTISAWSMNRVINQNCGQTWLNTFSDIASHYSAGNQLESLQLVTWNDYEEGTAIEMGIENCVAISGSASASVVSWNISGNENTINHYTVYISKDGENLMPVTDVPAGIHSVDMSQFGFAPGAYTVYVKAVGQPSIRNHMSGPIGYTSNGASSAQLPAGADLSLSATPTKITVAQGGAVSTTLTVTPTGNFDVPVQLGCSNMAAGLNCSFSQSTITPGTKTVTATVTVSANGGSTSASLFHLGGQFAIWFPAFGFGTVLFGDRKRTRKALIALVLIALAAAMITTGCGGGGKGSSSALSFGSANSTAPSTPGTYQVTIVAQAGTLQRTTTATVTVQ